MAKSPEEILKETTESIETLKDAFRSLGSLIDKQLKEKIKDADSFTQNYIRSVRNDTVSLLNQLGRKGEKIIDNQIKLNKGQLSSKDIIKQIDEIQARTLKTLNQINNAYSNGVIGKRELNKLTGKINEASNQTLEELQKQLIVSDKIENRLGSTLNVIKNLNKIPIIGGFIDTEEIITNVQAQAANLNGNFNTTNSVLSLVGKNLIDNVLQPTSKLASLVYFVNKGLIADDQLTKIARSFSSNKSLANVYREEIAEIARLNSDIFVTTKSLVESNLKLNQSLGVSRTFSGDILSEFVKLTEKIGISEESASGLARLTVITGKNAREITTNVLGSSRVLQSQYGILLNNRDILDETGKISGQLLANFKGNPVLIAEAVTQVKLLGTSLEQTNKQANSLLNFQSSIESELKAELMIGNQINLERARAAALMGDQAKVAKELSNQNMTFSKFSRLNVLAQRDFAEALGLSADELSDQLLKQEYLNKSRAEIVALGGEELAQRLETMSAQEKFNKAVEKLQDIFVSLIDGPIGQLLDVLVDVLGLIGKIGAALQEAIPEPVLKVLMGVGAGALIGGVPGAVVGGLGALGSELYNNYTEKTNDMYSNYGKRTLITPQGTYALNNKDTVIAGTNLFKGNDIYSGPEGAITLNNDSVVKAINELNSKIEQLSNRPVFVKPSEFATPITIKQLENTRRSI